MGKVQDTINRITRRQRPNAAQAIALIIPSQKAPTDTSFPISSDKVAEWLASLSAESRQTRIIALTRALQHSNRLINTASERFKITALFESHLRAVTGTLKELFVGSDLPFGNESTNAFDTTTTLLQELSYAYKIILIDVLRKRGSLKPDERTLAIYHAMRYLGESGLCYSQAYRSWPAKYWRDINTLFWLAEQEATSDQPVVHTVENKPGASTVRQLYISISLFKLTPGEHLSGSQMEVMYSELPGIAKLVDMQADQPATNDNLLYSVAINSTYPPAVHRYCNYSASDQVRYLNLLPAAQSVIESKSITNDCDRISGQKWRKIIQIWEGKRRRTSQRTICDRPIKVQVGLKDSHAFLQQKSRHSIVTETDWRLINQSNKGFCLRCNATTHHRISVGELIVCELVENHNVARLAGIIRWVKFFEPGEFQVGVELFGTSVSAVVCVKHANTSSTWEPKLEALMFSIPFTNVHNTAIALIDNHYRLGDSINVSQSYNASAATTFKLTELLDFDAQFECFRLSDTPAHQQVNLPLVT